MTLPPSAPLPTVMQTLLWSRYPTEFMGFCRRRYGKTFLVKLAGVPVSVFSDPDSIRKVFAAKPDEMHAGRFNSVLRAVVGSSSVLLLDGAQHMRERKLLMPAFHGERMRLYGTTMAEITRRTIAGWSRSQPFALHPHTQEITLQIILRTVFGATEGAQLQALHRQIKLMLTAGDSRLGLLALLALANRPEAETRVPWKWMLAQRDRVDAMLFDLIAARRRAGVAEQGTDVFSMLLQARDEHGEAMTDQALRDELMTALAAGHETTATSLAWAFERILSTPAVHTRLREEVRALGREPDPERLVTLPYLDATIKEVLRLRPVIGMVGRFLQQPTTIAGYDLPKGAAVGACIYLAQRNPDVYPEPNEFRPERFLGVQPDPASWLPFGGGIRRCIGAAFAQYEMKIVLATILANCDLELAQRTPARVIRRSVTFWPEGGTRVRLLN